MPSLGDAWADATLNDDGLRADLQRAEGLLQRAARRWERIATVRGSVDMNLSGVTAEIERSARRWRRVAQIVGRAVIDTTAATRRMEAAATRWRRLAQVTATVDVDSAQVAAELASERAGWDDIADVTANVTLGDPAAVTAEMGVLSQAWENIAAVAVPVSLDAASEQRATVTVAALAERWRRILAIEATIDADIVTVDRFLTAARTRWDRLVDVEATVALTDARGATRRLETVANEWDRIADITATVNMDTDTADGDFFAAYVDWQALARITVQARLDADSVDTEMAAAAARWDETADVAVNVELDEGALLARLAALSGAADRLLRVDATATVDTTRALADIAALSAAAAAVPDINLDVDSTGIEQTVTRIVAAKVPLALGPATIPDLPAFDAVEIPRLGVDDVFEPDLFDGTPFRQITAGGDQQAGLFARLGARLGDTFRARFAEAGGEGGFIDLAAIAARFRAVGQRIRQFFADAYADIDNDLDINIDFDVDASPVTDATNRLSDLLELTETAGVNHHIRFNAEVSDAITDLRRLQQQIEATRDSFNWTDIVPDMFKIGALEAQLDDLRRRQFGPEVDLDSIHAYHAQLDALAVQLGQMENSRRGKEGWRLSDLAAGFDEAQKTFEQFDATLRDRRHFRVDADIDEATERFAFLQGAFQSLRENIEINTDVDIGATLRKIGVLETEVAALADDIKIGVDSDTLFANLRLTRARVDAAKERLDFDTRIGGDTTALRRKIAEAEAYLRGVDLAMEVGVNDNIDLNKLRNAVLNAQAAVRDLPGLDDLDPGIRLDLDDLNEQIRRLEEGPTLGDRIERVLTQEVKPITFGRLFRGLFSSGGPESSEAENAGQRAAGWFSRGLDRLEARLAERVGSAVTDRVTVPDVNVPQSVGGALERVDFDGFAAEAERASRSVGTSLERVRGPLAVIGRDLDTVTGRLRGIDTEVRRLTRGIAGELNAAPFIDITPDDTPELGPAPGDRGRQRALPTPRFDLALPRVRVPDIVDAEIVDGSFIDDIAARVDARSGVFSTLGRRLGRLFARGIRDGRDSDGGIAGIIDVPSVSRLFDRVAAQARTTASRVSAAFNNRGESGFVRRGEGGFIDFGAILDGFKKMVDRAKSTASAVTDAFRSRRRGEEDRGIDMAAFGLSAIRRVRSLGDALRGVGRAMPDVGGLIDFSKVGEKLSDVGDAVGKAFGKAAVFLGKFGALAILFIPVVGALGVLVGQLAAGLTGVIGLAGGFLTVAASVGALAVAAGALGFALNPDLVNRFKNEFLNLKTELVDVFRPVAESFQDQFMGPAFDAVRNLAGVVAPLANSFLDPIAGAVIGWVNQLTGALADTTLFAQLGDGLASIITLFADYLEPFFRAIEGVSDDSFAGIEGFIRTLLDVGLAFTETWRQFITLFNVGEAAFTRTFLALNEVTTVLFRTINQLVSSGAFGDYIETLATGFQAAAEVTQATFDRLLSDGTIGRALDGFAALFVGAAEVLPKFAEALTALFAGLEPLFTGVMSGFGALFDGISRFATSPAFAAIAEFFGIVIDGIGRFIAAFLDGFAAATGTADAMTNSLSGVQQIMDFLVSVADDFGAAIGDLVELFTILVGLLGPIASLLTGIGGGFAGVAVQMGVFAFALSRVTGAMASIGGVSGASMAIAARSVGTLGIALFGLVSLFGAVGSAGESGGARLATFGAAAGALALTLARLQPLLSSLTVGVTGFMRAAGMSAAAAGSVGLLSGALLYLGAGIGILALLAEGFDGLRESIDQTKFSQDALNTAFATGDYSAQFEELAEQASLPENRSFGSFLGDVGTAGVWALSFGWLGKSPAEQMEEDRAAVQESLEQMFASIPEAQRGEFRLEAIDFLDARGIIGATAMVDAALTDLRVTEAGRERARLASMTAEERAAEAHRKHEEAVRRNEEAIKRMTVTVAGGTPVWDAYRAAIANTGSALTTLQNKIKDPFAFDLTPHLQIVDISAEVGPAIGRVLDKVNDERRKAHEKAEKAWRKDIERQKKALRGTNALRTGSADEDDFVSMWDPKKNANQAAIDALDDLEFPEFVETVTTSMDAVINSIVERMADLGSKNEQVIRAQGLGLRPLADAILEMSIEEFKAIEDSLKGGSDAELEAWSKRLEEAAAKPAIQAAEIAVGKAIDAVGDEAAKMEFILKLQQAGAPEVALALFKVPAEQVAAFAKQFEGKEGSALLTNEILGMEGRIRTARESYEAAVNKLIEQDWKPFKEMVEQGIVLDPITGIQIKFKDQGTAAAAAAAPQLPAGISAAFAGDLAVFLRDMQTEFGGYIRGAIANLTGSRGVSSRNMPSRDALFALMKKHGMDLSGEKGIEAQRAVDSMLERVGRLAASGVMSDEGFMRELDKLIKDLEAAGAAGSGGGTTIPTIPTVDVTPFTDVVNQANAEMTAAVAPLNEPRVVTPSVELNATVGAVNVVLSEDVQEALLTKGAEFSDWLALGFVLGLADAGNTIEIERIGESWAQALSNGIRKGVVPITSPSGLDGGLYAKAAEAQGPPPLLATVDAAIQAFLDAITAAREQVAVEASKLADAFVVGFAAGLLLKTAAQTEAVVAVGRTLGEAFARGFHAGAQVVAPVEPAASGAAPTGTPGATGPTIEMPQVTLALPPAAADSAAEQAVSAYLTALGRAVNLPFVQLVASFHGGVIANAFGAGVGAPLAPVVALHSGQMVARYVQGVAAASAGVLAALVMFAGRGFAVLFGQGVATPVQGIVDAQARALVFAFVGAVNVMVNDPAVTGGLYTNGQLVGQAFGDGVIEGLRLTTPGVRSAAEALADEIRTAMEERLEINSPSRVGQGIGGYVGEGVALGIESKTSKVATAAAGLASVALPDIGRFKVGDPYFGSPDIPIPVPAALATGPDGEAVAAPVVVHLPPPRPTVVVQSDSELLSEVKRLRKAIQDQEHVHFEEGAIVLAGGGHRRPAEGRALLNELRGLRWRSAGKRIDR